MTNQRVGMTQFAQKQRHALLSGFSLVELMVAMVIGMLGIIVMMQMFRMFEGQKRTTVGGDDAISSGAISLYGLQRDIQQSGLGISSLQVIGCSVTGFAKDTTISLAPVTIFPSGVNGLGIPLPDSNTDMLMIVSGNGNGTVEGDIIDSQVPASSSYAVHAASSFGVGQSAQPGPPAVPAVPPDHVLAVPATRLDSALCGPVSANLVLATVAGVARPNVTVGSAGYVSGLGAGARLFNLGASPKVHIYAVRNQNLTVCDFVNNDCTEDISGMSVADRDALWAPIANNVVSLRVQYGRDTNTAGMDGIIDSDGWGQTVPTPAVPSGNYGPACGLLRVSAVRLVLVARSSQPEKRLDGTTDRTSLYLGKSPYVTPAAPAWAGSAGAPISPPGSSSNWPTWQDYRYKVFQTVVPLRNVTTMGVVSGC